MQMRSRLAAAGLLDVADKLDAGVRLDLEDGVRLSDTPDLLALGWLANRERERRHGARAYFNYNIRLEATNVCVASCLFCSFARLKPGDPGAYTMSLEQAWDKLRSRSHQPLTEVHVVNGLHPDLPFDYYTDLLRGFKAIRPAVHLKCFTAVEIAFFSDIYHMSDEEVLVALMAAGLDSLPGGGAEIFADRVRKKIAHDKCGADRYLDIHRIAHRLGMRSNVTMLYGHIETRAGDIRSPALVFAHNEVAASICIRAPLQAARCLTTRSSRPTLSCSPIQRLPRPRLFDVESDVTALCVRSSTVYS